MSGQKDNNPIWQELYETLAHGDDEHKAWLRGMIQGFASAKAGCRIVIQKDHQGGSS